MDGLDWLAMWRFGTLGWARTAAAEAGDRRRLPRPRPDRPAGRGRAAAAQRRRGSSTTATSSTSTRATVGRPRLGGELARPTRARLARRSTALVTVNAIARRRSSVRGSGSRRSWSSTTARPAGDLGAARADEPPPGGDRATGRRAGRPLRTAASRAGPRSRGAGRAMLEPGLEGVHLAYLGYGAAPHGTSRIAGRPALSAAGSTARRRCRRPTSSRWVASADVGGMAIQADEPQLPAVDPEQAVRVARRGRAGRRERLPGHPHDRGSTTRKVRSASCCDPTVAGLDRGGDPLDPRAVAGRYARPAPACRHAAVERWNWETESAKLVALYRGLGPG